MRPARTYCAYCSGTWLEYQRRLKTASRRHAAGDPVDLKGLIAAKEKAEDCDHRPRGSQVRASTPGAAS